MKQLLRYLALSLAAACAAVALSPTAASASVDPRTGADYSWYRPSTAQLNAAHVGWVARYIVPASWRSGKALTATEAVQLRSAGRTIVLNFEWSATSAKGGYAAGQRDARSAEVARIEVGAPWNVPIYFSIDYDERNTAVVVNYLNGAASVLGKGRIGVYGGYYVVRAAMNAGFPYGWQTYAWSRGQWDGRAQLRQTRNGAVFGGQGDLDYAQNTVFGGWAPGGPVFVPGKPSVSPAPAPSSGAHPTLRQGSRGAAVATVQRAVHIGADGVFGPRTAAAVRAFQRAHRLTADGVVGPRTWAVLLGVSPAPKPAAARYVTVHSGDTLGKIAARNGSTTWQRLAALNHLANPNRIYAGQRLRVR